MSELAARHLHRRTGAAPRVRDQPHVRARAQELAKTFAGIAVPFEDLDVDAARAVDIVIASTGGARAHRARGRRAAGAPGAARAAAVPHRHRRAAQRRARRSTGSTTSFCYDIDDLRAVVEANLRERAARGGAGARRSSSARSTRFAARAARARGRADDRLAAREARDHPPRRGRQGARAACRPPTRRRARGARGAVAVASSTRSCTRPIVEAARLVARGPRARLHRAVVRAVRAHGREPPAGGPAARRMSCRLGTRGQPRSRWCRPHRWRRRSRAPASRSRSCRSGRPATGSPGRARRLRRQGAVREGDRGGAARRAASTSPCTA